MTATRTVLACCLVLTAGTASAERYAVLVGVSTYAASGTGADLDLEGPVEDVRALARLLVDRFGFAERQITTLVNEAATRQSILATLASTTARLRDGDYLLFYFSGHGTSSFDPKMRPISAFIGPNSGALAPYDLRIDSAENAASSLIVGQRDLRPLLERVPQGAKVAVILDACYSENAVRSIPASVRGKTRGVTLGTLLPRDQPRPNAAGVAPDVQAMEAEQRYPYTNVITLTAASKDEPAFDIDRRMLVNGRYPTIDGRPHGAFTNSLLRALSGDGDGNHDGTITFQELYDFTRQAVQARHAHTPQLLAPANRAAVHASALGLAGAAPALSCQPQVGSPSADVRVRLDDVALELRQRLTSAPGIRIVTDTADLLVRATPASLDIHDAGGVLIRQFVAGDVDGVAARVRTYAAAMRLTALAPSCPSFGLSLRLLPAGRIRFSHQDRIDVSAELERPAYLLALNIDTAGAVSVVYPATLAENTRHAAGAPVMLGTVQPVAPYGSEWLKLLAFAEPPAFDRLGCRTSASGLIACPVIEPGSAGFDGLLQWLAAIPAVAESRLRFVTQE